MLSCVSKFFCRLIFSGSSLLKISFNQFLRLTKKCVKICMFRNIYAYVYICMSLKQTLTRTRACLNWNKMTIAVKSNIAECFTLGISTPFW